jgi:ATP-dependent RNA helicase DeaD
VRVFVSVGRKDQASAKDLVGALIKEAGLQKGQIGKIDVRETFSLVDVAPAVAEQAVQRMAGVSVRGRRVTARPDRT